MLGCVNKFSFSKSCLIVLSRSSGFYCALRIEPLVVRLGFPVSVKILSSGLQNHREWSFILSCCCYSSGFVVISCFGVSRKPVGAAVFIAIVT